MRIKEALKFQIDQKHKFFLMLLFLVMSKFLFSQNSISISGFVSDFNNKETLINASVYTESGNLVYTNEYGHFTIQIEKGTQVSITTSYVGYNDLSIQLACNQDSIINFDLKPVSLETVIVIAENKSNQFEYLKKLQVEQLVELPTIGGEKDILKALTFYPGVTIGAEGTSELFVRGGTSDQNLYLLDQIPVYNVTHLGGFLSVFNADAMQNIDFYKSGFPARYSGRLSSVVDISLKEGSKNDFGGNYSIGIITSKLLLEGPLTKKKNASFLFASRTSYIGLVNLFRNREDLINYWLYDINAKLNYNLKKGKLFFSYYSGLDNGSSRSTGKSTSLNRVLRSSISDFKVNWGNQTISTRYVRSIGSNLFLKSVLGFTKYSYNSIEESRVEQFISENLSNIEVEQNKFDSDISSFIGRLDLDYSQNRFLSWNFGVYAEFQKNSSNNFINPIITNSANYLDGYIESRIPLGKIGINTGLRFSNYLSEGTYFNSLQPRFKLDYKVKENSSFVFNYSRMVQYLHQLTLNTLGLPVNTWLNSNSFIEPETSDQVSLAFNYTQGVLKTGTLEVFYKRQNNLIEYNDSNQDFIFADAEGTLDLISTDGQGEIYGAEFFLASEIGKLSLSGAYTLSWNYRQFEDLNNGEKYPFRFDRRHDFSVNAAYQFAKKWKFNTTFVYQSGSRFTSPVANVKIPNIESPKDVFGSRNNVILPDHHRLDLSILYTMKKGAKTKKWELTIYNVYNRANVNSVFIGSDAVFDSNGEFSNTKPNLMLVSNFSIIPSLSYSLDF